jgi:hypothetical protein
MAFAASTMLAVFFESRPPRDAPFPLAGVGAGPVEGAEARERGQPDVRGRVHKLAPRAAEGVERHGDEGSPCGSPRTERDRVVVVDPSDSLKQAALEILGSDPAGPRIARTMQAVYDLMEAVRWDGACHAISALMFVLLREQGVQATLRLGEVAFGDGHFDHSWIEINGAVFDVAIARPLDPVSGHSPVVGGRHVHDGQPTPLIYGAVSGLPQDADAARRQNMQLGEYMDVFPEHPQGLWGVAVDVGAQLGLHASAHSLRQRYSHVEWSRRRVPSETPMQGVPSTTLEARNRERNRRKRERRGR